jgi:hypothetical protein
MNPLFSLPLHGVFCVPFCGPKNNNLPVEISLGLSSVTFDKALEPIWSMIDEGERYHSEIHLYKEPLPDVAKVGLEPDKNSENNYYLSVNCQGNGLFKITKNSITIDWKKQGTGADHYFQTLAVALNLELNNILCIHANALAYQDKAIAIVAPSRTGKTTLTAALSQNGFALMTDDMMALHPVAQGYEVYSSWPVIRMWPDALNNMQLEASEQYKKVHEQFEKRIVNIEQSKGFEFCTQPKKLHVIYLLNRLPKEQKNSNTPICEIVPIATAQAIIVLLQNSILGSCYRALNLENSRLKALSKLLTTVTFKQINYVSGKEHLGAVGKLIKNDL